MTNRDRRALIIGALIVAGSVCLRVLPPVFRHANTMRTSLQARAALLARAKQELTHLPLIRDSVRILSRAIVALAPRLLSGSTTGDAGADLSARINLFASRAPARVERIEIVPDTTMIGRLGHVRVRASIETDVRGLSALLRRIDSGNEVITIDELHVETTPTIGFRAPERLKLQLLVSGWFIKTVDKPLAGLTS